MNLLSLTGHGGFGCVCERACVRERALPVHPELDGDAAAASVVAGEAGCGGRELVRSLQELLQGSGAPDPPALTAG